MALEQWPQTNGCPAGWNWRPCENPVKIFVVNCKVLIRISLHAIVFLEEEDAHGQTAFERMEHRIDHFRKPILRIAETSRAKVCISRASVFLLIISQFSKFALFPSLQEVLLAQRVRHFRNGGLSDPRIIGALPLVRAEWIGSSGRYRGIHGRPCIKTKPVVQVSIAWP